MLLKWLALKATANVSETLRYLFQLFTGSGMPRGHKPAHVGGIPPFLFLVTCRALECRTERYYDAFVLSFNRRVSTKIKRAAMRSFELVIFPGLAGRVPILWIEHDDHERTELHGLICRIDLLSSNIHTPFLEDRDEYRLWLWRKRFSFAYGVVDVDLVPRLVRTLPWGRPQLLEAQKAIASAVTQIMELHKPTSREVLVQHLRDLGYVPVEETKDAVSFQVEGLREPVRMFGKAFQCGSWTSAHGPAWVPPKDRAEHDAVYAEKLKRSMNYWSSVYQKRYGTTQFPAKARANGYIPPAPVARFREQIHLREALQWQQRQAHRESPAMTFQPMTSSATCSSSTKRTPPSNPSMSMTP